MATLSVKRLQLLLTCQAATAYLHANDSTMPGNANRIITNGTSAGGAVSLLQGATGNNSDFQPYLQALGAATGQPMYTQFLPMHLLQTLMRLIWPMNGAIKVLHLSTK